MLCPGGSRVYPRALVAAAPAIGLALLLLLPFYRKAYTMDDTLFMLQAQQLLRDPLHPTALDGVGRGPAAAVGDHAEWAGDGVSAVAGGGARRGGVAGAWGVQGLVLALGLFATSALALRLGYSALGARLAALLVATTPAVLGMAGTVMPDIPAMALAFALDLFVGFTQASHPIQSWPGVFLPRSRLGWRRCRVLISACSSASRRCLLTRQMRAGIGHRCDGGSSARCGRSAPAGSALPAGSAGHAGPASEHRVTSSIGHFASLDGLPKNLLAFFAHASLALPLCLPWAVLRRRSSAGG